MHSFHCRYLSTCFSKVPFLLLTCSLRKEHVFFSLSFMLRFLRKRDNLYDESCKSLTQKKGGHRPTICNPLKLLGWETRIRTWVDGVRVRSPSAGRSPIKIELLHYLKPNKESIKNRLRAGSLRDDLHRTFQPRKGSLFA
jgi:hypothetical protein